jgi:hypothetical protein
MLQLLHIDGPFYGCDVTKFETEIPWFPKREGRKHRCLLADQLPWRSGDQTYEMLSRLRIPIDNRQFRPFRVF